MVLCGHGVSAGSDTSQDESCSGRMDSVGRYYFPLDRQLWEDGALSALAGSTSPSILSVPRVMDTQLAGCYPEIQPSN